MLFDDTNFYRNLFNALPGSKGVDFLSVDAEYVGFIEVKNCQGDKGNCRWRIFPNNHKRDTSLTKVSVVDSYTYIPKVFKIAG